MASNKTTNLGLNQWEAEDAVLREDFNADNAKIDAALANVGNCKIVSGTYTGNGKFGAGNPNRLTFDEPPLFLFVSAEGYGFQMWCGRGHTKATATCANNSLAMVQLTWTDTGVSWYHDSFALQQMNENKQVYRYIGLLATE